MGFSRLATVVFCLLLLAVPAAAEDDVVLVLDASGSMWGQIAGENKIVIARRAVRGVVGRLDTGIALGLVAYGHRRDGDCADIEVIAEPARGAGGQVADAVDALNPKGKTPLTAAVERAIALLGDGGGTVVLISDGLETCGGDPCAVVRAARGGGADFLLHVVGFDLGDADASALECAAQEGGGLYFDARDAAGLAAALERAVVEAPAAEAGRLFVKVVADGALADAVVEVRPAGGGDVLAAGRTYTGEATNPRSLPVPAGRYDVHVRPLKISGSGMVLAGVVVPEEGTVVKLADFSSGELAVLVQRNGALSDATVNVYAGGARVAGGRSYVSASSNPRVFRLPAGDYRVEIGSVEISGKPTATLAATVLAGERSEVGHGFASGTLVVGAWLGDERVDATVAVYDAAAGRVASGRTYTGESSNPKTFVVPPGSYRLVVKPLKPAGLDTQERRVDVEAGGEVAERFDFGG